MPYYTFIYILKHFTIYDVRRLLNFENVTVTEKHGLIAAYEI